MKNRGMRQGRQKAIGLVDVICGKEENLEKLRVAMQAEFDRDPMAFFRTIIMPLAPKERIPEVEAMLVQWTPADIVRDMDASTEGDANGES